LSRKFFIIHPSYPEEGLFLRENDNKYFFDYPGNLTNEQAIICLGVTGGPVLDK